MKYFEFFRQYIPDLPQPNERGEVRVPCIFHKDTDPSLGINVEQGKWKCYSPACPGHKGGGYRKFAQIAKGEIPGAEMRTEHIDPAIVDAHHKVLLSSQATMEFLQRKRGLSLATIERFRLGWDSDRVWIPILDVRGQVTNVRKYKSGAHKDKMVGFAAGYNKAALFPVENLKSPWVLLCEGEMDCMVACQYGFPAVTTTGGADTWLNEFNQALKGKRVFICYDADESGDKGATKAAISLLPFASEVRRVRLPLAGTKIEKDVTDYFVNLGHSKADMEELLARAELVESKVASGVAPAEEVVQLHLSEIGEDRFVGKRVEAKVLIAGKDLAPFQVPWKLGFACDGGEKICARCGICRNGGQLEVQVPNWSDKLLEMVNVHKDKLEEVIADLAGVPERCRRFRVEVKEYATIESVKAIPEIDFDSAQVHGYVIRNLYYLGHGLETNHTYLVRAVVMPDPKTQYATALIYDAVPSQDNIEQFELTPEMAKALEIFRVGDAV